MGLGNDDKRICMVHNCGMAKRLVLGIFLMLFSPYPMEPDVIGYGVLDPQSAWPMYGRSR